MAGAYARAGYGVRFVESRIGILVMSHSAPTRSGADIFAKWGALFGWCDGRGEPQSTGLLKTRIPIWEFFGCLWHPVDIIL